MGAPHQGQLRVNLADKERRTAASHAVALWVPPGPGGDRPPPPARLAIVEVPPGPPVLQTLVGEVYGPPGASYARIIREAEKIKGFFLKIPGIVDVDTSVATYEPRFRFLVDRQKAALSGLGEAQVARGLAIAEAGETVGRLHVDAERLPLDIRLRWPLVNRTARRFRPTLFPKPFRNHDSLTGIGRVSPGGGAASPSCGKTWRGWCWSPEIPRA